MPFPSLSLRELVAGLVLLALLTACYLALVLTDHDPGGFVTFVVTLAGLAGVTGHQVKQGRAINDQSAVIAKIDAQTNGVLDSRIKTGVKSVLSEAGVIPNDP